MIGVETSPRAVLFDLDDTLIDRSRTLLRFAEMLASDFAETLLEHDPTKLLPLLRRADRNGYRTREELADNLVAMLPWRAAPRAEALARYWAQHFGPCSTASAGALGLVSWLRARGVKVGLVTNGAPTQHVKIDALNVRPHLDAVVVSDEVGVAKPDEAIFRIALGKLGVEADEAWFVGDHPVNDVIGAERAGMRAFWLRRDGLGWPEGQPVVGAAIDSLEELLPLLVEANLEAAVPAIAPAAEPALGG
jgi:putative hydrolase of the HAD superfamily